MQRFYGDEEAQTILRTALGNASPEAAISREELLRTGAEMGLDEAQIVRAEAEVAAAREVAHRRQSARRVFVGHFATYAITILGLLLINLLTSPRYLWVMWPALGWGIGVASQAMAVLFPKGDEPTDPAPVAKG